MHWEQPLLWRYGHPFFWVHFSVPWIWFVHASDQWDISTRDSGDFRKPFETQESTNCQICDSCMCAKSLQLCLTLRDPMDRSLPGFSVQGILQARILEWIVMPSSRGPCQPRNWTSISCFLNWQVGSLPQEPPGKPRYVTEVILNHLAMVSPLANHRCMRKPDREELSWTRPVDSPNRTQRTLSNIKLLFEATES